MSAPLLRGRALLRQRVLGLAFLAVLAAAVLLTVALYQQRFTRVADVVLLADRAGNQLTKGADVKLRGLVVGRVRDIDSTGDGARLTLAIQRDKTDLVPRDVQAQLLPKTLFGEKFVALVIPEDASGERIEDGDTISQDRSETARETAEALDGLLPLLQALHPDDLSVTLNALSSALRGRGERIGENLVLVDRYLREINPEIPALGENFRGVADLADNLDASADDLVQVLDNLAAVNRNLVDQEQELSAFLDATAGSVAELDRFLRENDDRLIRLAADSLPSLQVYARYAPEYPCFLAGLVKAQPLIEDTFGGLQPGLHITLEFTDDNGPYVPGDEPVYGDDGGPTCRGLPPNPPEVPFPFYRNGVDGYRDGQPVDPQTGEHGPGGEQPSDPDPDGGRSVRAQSTDWTKAILGAATAQPADAVPDIAALLFEPLARGTQVRLEPR